MQCETGEGKGEDHRELANFTIQLVVKVFFLLDVAAGAYHTGEKLEVAGCISDISGLSNFKHTVRYAILVNAQIISVKRTLITHTAFAVGLHLLPPPPGLLAFLIQL